MNQMNFEYELVKRSVSATVRLAVCLGLAAGLSGCGGGVEPPETERVNASGKVEFDGKPVPAGTVSFLHESTGHNAICTISDGTYESTSGKGPNPGKNVVMITAQESAEGNPMWGQPWKKRVEVGDADFAEDFTIPADQVRPFDPKNAIQADEEKSW